MSLTSTYVPLTKTVTLDLTDLPSAELRQLLVDGEVIISNIDASEPTVDYVVPTDSIITLTVNSYDSDNGLIDSSDIKQLTTEYAYDDNVALLKSALYKQANLDAFYDNLRLRGSITSYFWRGNYPKSQQILDYYADAR